MVQHLLYLKPSQLLNSNLTVLILIATLSLHVDYVDGLSGIISNLVR